MPWSSRLYGLGVMFMGLICVAWRDFDLGQPVPTSFPERTALACGAGALMIVTGAAVGWRRTAAWGAAALAGYYALIVVVLMYGHLALSHYAEFWVYSGAAEQLAIATGGMLIYAATRMRLHEPLRASLTHLGQRVFGVCALLFGGAHFFYMNLTVPLVPKWLPPNPTFWAYATGVAHIAAGMAILTGVKARLAAIWLTVMFASFTPLVHLPMLLNNPASRTNWSENALNLALVGVAWVVADSLRGELPPKDTLPWRDTLAVLVATALTIVLSAHFNWSEALYALTRREERLQLDELPMGVLVLLVGLIWLAWRRNRQARREIGARRVAEARLEEALAANRALAKETLRIQEVDRKHLALELHDELGQYLNAIKLDAVSIRDGASRDLRGPAEASDAIIRTVDHLHGIVSQMIARLRPVALDELGLLAAVEHGIDQWRRRLPRTQFGFSTQGSFDGLDESLNLTAYRLIQEGLTNIYKHANARHVEILLTRSVDGARSELCVSVADDGCGTDLRGRTTGHGLNGMRERTELSGGTFSIDSAPGRGLRFEARLPVTRSA